MKDRVELDQAWRLVLEDPNYEHRRRYYEHLVSSEQRKAEEDARIRKKEGQTKWANKNKNVGGTNAS